MPPYEEVLHVQGELFKDELSQRNIDTDALVKSEDAAKMFSFLAENSQIFRLFTEDLSPEVREIWNRYTQGDGNALKDLEKHYDSFRDEIEDFISRLDPDMQNEFSNAIDQGDLERASSIIKTFANLRTKEER